MNAVLVLFLLKRSEHGERVGGGGGGREGRGILISVKHENEFDMVISIM